MSDIFLRGWGAVSPAGWSARELIARIEGAQPVSTTTLPHPKYAEGLAARVVPAQGKRALPHARLRRTSPISQYAAAAAMEAMGDDAAKAQRGEIRTGVVFCVMNGCVNFSGRFYKEVLQDPSTASPLLFPETVANAPASHVSALLGTTALNYTLLGDQTALAQGLALAADWLAQGKVDGCLVLAAEEADWPIMGAAHLLHPDMVVGEGAGAVYLSATPGDQAIRLDRISDVLPWGQGASQQIQEQIGTDGELLSDSAQGICDLDQLEEAWRDWPSRRFSVRKTLGEGFNASAAWQCVAAAEWLATQANKCAALVSILGLNKWAAGVKLVRD
jgi:hypothetical protein